jgi:SagB-type dehydrogenase family enzyme
MKKQTIAIIGIILVAVILGGVMWRNSIPRFKRQEPESGRSIGDTIALPTPVFESETSVEHALQERRSVRTYRDEPLTLAEISQLLWAAQGITHPAGYRTAPSAGALYPLELYVLAGNVTDLPDGVYHYLPHEHELVRITDGDKREALGKAALDQEAVSNAAAVIVITAVYERTTIKYSERGIQYVHMEVGSAAQNVYLQATSLGLGTVFIGAFHDDEVKEVLNIGDEERPLCLMPVGRPGE